MQLPQFQTHAALEGSHWWFTGRREILLTLLHYIAPPSKEKQVVDIGCGTGGNTAEVAKEYTCVGIDPIPEAIAFARERFPECRFICGQAPDDVHQEVQVADVVLLLDVLEHVLNDRQLVSDLLKNMKPGAFLLIMVPADPTLWSPHDKGFEHYRRYTLATLQQTWGGQRYENFSVRIAIADCIGQFVCCVFLRSYVENLLVRGIPTWHSLPTS